MSYLYGGDKALYRQYVENTKGVLRVVSPSYFDLDDNGNLVITPYVDPAFIKDMHRQNIKVVPFVSNHWDQEKGKRALENRHKLADDIANFMQATHLDGVNVDIENVTEEEREIYTDFVKLLRNKVPINKEVSVAVVANPNEWNTGWHGSNDYANLHKYSDYLMIMAYDESYQGGPEGPIASYPWVEKSIQYALKQGVPSDKIVLGLPFFGRYWMEGEESGGNGIVNKAIIGLVSKYNGIVDFDEETKSAKATVMITNLETLNGRVLSPGTYHFWYDNLDSIKAKMELVKKYRLKGTGSWKLGDEDRAIWDDSTLWTGEEHPMLPPSKSK
ncbi:glycosylase [Bacillus sp. 165]|nr:glycosylase [Bacillus sp. 165]